MQRNHLEESSASLKRAFSIYICCSLLVVLATVLLCTANAGAQTQGSRSADVQYEQLSPPSGPLSGETMCVPAEGSGGGLGADSILTVPVGVTVSPGASVTFVDGDGTHGTLTEGLNADFANGLVTVTGDPENVYGGNDRLDDGCLTIISSTGMTASETSDPKQATGVLPLTGGSLAGLLAAGMLVSLIGVVVLRNVRDTGNRHTT